METLETKAALLAAILRAAKAARESGLDDDGIAEMLGLAKDTIEANA